MSTRRSFLKRAASGLLMASATRYAQGTNVDTYPLAGIRRKVQRSSNRIQSVVRRDDTILRLGGVGDNFHMTWTADDQQLTAVCDGTGWIEPPNRLYNSRLFRIVGNPQSARFEDVPTYPDLIANVNSTEVNRYYGFGTIAVDGHIYQFLSTPNHRFFEKFAGDPMPGARFVGAKLIHSPDSGRTWRNQDGSTPVRWESWSERSCANMMFYEEEQSAFSLISILQMGQDYGDNKDGYVYGYSPNGCAEGSMNQLVMFRVAKAHICERNAYQFFAGFKSQVAQWSDDISAREPILNFPGGWVNEAVHPWAWMPSVAYNKPLGLYIMASWGTGLSAAGHWFGKPSYLGLWASTTPWGAWEQIYEEAVWTPGGDGNARAFAPQISPKWIAEDGRALWLVWSDFQGAEAAGSQAKRLAEEVRKMDGLGQARAMGRLFQRYLPYYSFNAQRVDLVVK